MARILALFVGMAGIALCQNRLTPQERKDGFELLFDGKTLAHWHSAKERSDAGAWHVRKGTITWNKGGSWLATRDTYYDFVLRLEYRTVRGGSSGILLRATQSGNPAFSGMKLQILSDAGKPPSIHSTGSVYGAVAPAKNMALPDGRWNRVEVTLVKRELSVVWNADRILIVNLDDPKYKDAEDRPLSERVPFGHIGLEAPPAGARAEFRNIRLKVVRSGPSFNPSK